MRILIRGFLFLILLLWLLRVSVGGFIRSHALKNNDPTIFSLDRLVIFVAIDEEKEVMKFLVNSKVKSAENPTITDPVITDVDPDTNRYTTLNVEVYFMGKIFKRENLRFCNTLMVKNTSLFEDTHRFGGGLTNATATSTLAAPSRPTPFGNPDLPGQRPPAGNSTFRNTFGALRVNQRSIDDDSYDSNNDTASLDIFPAFSNSSFSALFSNRTGDLILCPLYVNDSIAFYYQVNVSQNLHRFGSYAVHFSVVSNNEGSDVIGGAIGYVTSSVKRTGLENLLFYGFLSVCVCAFVMNFMIIIFSPDQESQNPFLIEASAICNEGLLKQLEAHPLALISYLQFALFMSGLNVLYPGFFQYYMGRIKWCALLSINLFYTFVSIPTLDADNVYLTYYSGLKGLGLYSSDGFSPFSWPSFIFCLLVWTFAGMACYQVFIVVKVLARRINSPSFLRKLFGNHSGSCASNSAATTNSQEKEKDPSNASFTYSLPTNMAALYGHFLREVLLTFGFPFLVLTMFMLFRASRPPGLRKGPSEYSAKNAFSAITPYSILRFPRVRCVPPQCTNVQRNLTNPFDEFQRIPPVNVIFGVLTLCAWLGTALWFLYYYILPILVKVREKHNVLKLYTSVRTIVTWGYMYNAYKPSKVYYVAVDVFACMFSLIVIATMHGSGSVQVSLLLVIEVARFVSLFIFRPYFLALSWHSLPVLMLTSRLLVTFLNIPYLRSLKVSETRRTYVAYAQMLLHCIVALAYILHLIYCLTITIIAAVKLHWQTLTEGKLSTEEANVSDVKSVGAFEFRQVSTLPSSCVDLHEDDIESHARSSLDAGEMDYYRSKSEHALRHMESHDCDDEMVDNGNAADDSSLDYYQAESRIHEQDYTTREADRIFQKYFSGCEMDPEMKALWESRDWHKNGRSSQTGKNSGGVQTGGLFRMCAGLWGSVRLPSKQKRFEVVCRKPIVVVDTNPTGVLEDDTDVFTISPQSLAHSLQSDDLMKASCRCTFRGTA